MKRNRRILSALILILLLVLAANLSLGASGIHPGEILRAAFSSHRESTAARILWYVRLPRALAAMLAGSALAAAGLLLQVVLRNPLAAPSVVGVNTGAGLCALVCTALLPELSGFVPLAAFMGACLAVFGVYLLARTTGASRSTIVLSGVAVNAMLGAGMDAIVSLVPDAALARSAFSIGGFAGVSMQQLAFATPLAGLALLLAGLFHREMDLLALGDDVAQSLGLRAERYRALFLLCAAMLAGAAVSFTGLLGFVGLIAPHMARLLCRGEASLRLPITAILGASLCLICDLIAHTLFAPYELPVGVVLSLLGAPFFLYLLLAQRRRNRHSAT